MKFENYKEKLSKNIYEIKFLLFKYSKFNSNLNNNLSPIARISSKINDLNTLNLNVELLNNLINDTNALSLSKDDYEFILKLYRNALKLYIKLKNDVECIFNDSTNL